MCCSFDIADFKNTIVYAAASINKQFHLLGYQNEALSSGPNCMILPIPSKSALTSENMVDCSDLPSFLKQMSQKINRHRGAIAAGAAGLTKRTVTQLFHKGSYSVILFSNFGSAVEELWNTLPEERKCPLNWEICEAYQNKFYRDWSFALCFWNGNIEAEPLFWKFEPLNPNMLFFPTLDAHNGNVPNLYEKVKLDHTLIVGFQTEQTGCSIALNRDIKIPEKLKGILPNKFKGISMKETLRNGDFYFDLNAQIIRDRYSHTDAGLENEHDLMRIPPTLTGQFFYLNS